MPANKPMTEDPARAPQSSKAATGFPMAVGTVFFQAWLETGTEAVRFARDRLQKDIKAQQAMFACNSLDEMRRIQTEFFTTAREQYAVEAGKMLDLLGKATAAGLTVSEKARSYDDVPL